MVLLQTLPTSLFLERIKSDAFNEQSGLDWYQCVYEFTTDMAHLMPVASYITEHLLEFKKIPPTICENMQLVLQEAIANAVVHGNLGISSFDPMLEDFDRYENEIQERLSCPFFAERKIKIRIQRVFHQWLIEVEDEGEGYDVAEAKRLQERSFYPRGLEIIRLHTAAVEIRNKGKLMIMRLVDETRKQQLA